MPKIKIVIEYTLAENSLTFAVRVQPRASKTAIVGAHDNALKVRLAAPPVDGAANAELIRLLAKLFGVTRAAIEIVAGETNKQKIVRVNGVNGPEAEAVLLTATEAS